MCSALIGLLGAIIGAAGVIMSTIVNHHLAESKQEKIDAPRKAMLLSMLQNMPNGTEWRRMETLSRVIGASREDTARLLISIGARGNENGNDVWALINDKPLPLNTP